MVASLSMALLRYPMPAKQPMPYRPCFQRSSPKGLLRWQGHPCALLRWKQRTNMCAASSEAGHIEGHGFPIAFGTGTSTAMRMLGWPCCAHRANNKHLQLRLPAQAGNISRYT